MTKDEILLLNKLIESTVRNTVEKVIDEKIGKMASFASKKDLKEVKLLLATLIKEGRSVPSKPVISEAKSGQSRKKHQLTPELKQILGIDTGTIDESLEIDPALLARKEEPAAKTKKMLPAISYETGLQISTGQGELPDIGDYIPGIDTSSDVFQALQEKLGS